MIVLAHCHTRGIKHSHFLRFCYHAASFCLKNSFLDWWYGSKFVVVWTFVEQLIDLGLMLRYLRFPIHFKSYMFGDNESG